METRIEREALVLTVLIRDGDLHELTRKLGEMSRRHAKRVVRCHPFDNWNGTLLHMAVRHDHRGRCDCGRDRNLRCEVVFTDQHRVEIVQLLLQHGAQKVALDGYDETAFEVADAGDRLSFSNPAFECLPQLLDLLRP